MNQPIQSHDCKSFSANKFFFHFSFDENIFVPEKKHFITKQSRAFSDIYTETRSCLEDIFEPKKEF